MPILAAVAMLAASGVFAAAAPARAATTTLCNSQTAAVAGGAYTVQNNEWNSSAPECVTTDGNADFTVANSSINLSGGAPGGYPSIYKGCHWGACTSNSGLPIPVSSMTPGEVTTSWSTTQTSGAYDVAYDIWYNQTPTTSGQPNAEEMMIWINHTGGVEPFGSVVASNVSIGGRTWTIWEGRMSIWNVVSYVLNTGVTSVSNLDVDLLAADSVQPRLHDQLGLPDRPGGRLRAVEWRHWTRHQLLLGEHRRRHYAPAAPAGFWTGHRLPGPVPGRPRRQHRAAEPGTGLHLQRHRRPAVDLHQATPCKRSGTASTSILAARPTAPPSISTRATAPAHRPGSTSPTAST